MKSVEMCDRYPVKKLINIYTPNWSKQKKCSKTLVPGLTFTRSGIKTVIVRAAAVADLVTKEFY